MIRYRDWQPTSFDVKGLSLPDRQDWLVAPVMRTRDTADALTLSNFTAALEILGGESEQVEVHSFNHWGPGWFEIILVAPELADKLEEIEAALSDYPVLDESAMSELECEHEAEAWSSWYRGDWCNALAAAYDLEDVFTDEQIDELFERFRDRAGVYWRHDNEGACIDLDRVIESLPDSLDELLAYSRMRAVEDEGQGRLFQRL